MHAGARLTNANSADSRTYAARVNLSARTAHSTAAGRGQPVAAGTDQIVPRLDTSMFELWICLVGR